MRLAVVNMSPSSHSHTTDSEGIVGHMDTTTVKVEAACCLKAPSVMWIS